MLVISQGLLYQVIKNKVSERGVVKVLVLLKEGGLQVP